MNPEINLKPVYMTGAISAVIVILLTVLDIIIGISLGGDLSSIPSSAGGKLIQINEHMWLGLYNLDLLNLTTAIIMIPVFTALYAAIKNSGSTSAILALVIFIIGTAVFIACNAALPMLDLSRKYNATPVYEQKMLIASAGEAIISRGEHGSPGIFPGFILITISELIISMLMLRGDVFSKATAWFGISGTVLMLVYLTVVTFLPGAKSFAMILAAPGGILSLVWMVLFTLRLFRLGRSGNR